MHGMEEKENLLTVKEVATALRVDQTTVRRWLKNGSLAGICFPEKKEHGPQRQTHRIRQSVLDALLDSQSKNKGKLS